MILLLTAIRFLMLQIDIRILYLTEQLSKVVIFKVKLKTTGEPVKN